MNVLDFHNENSARFFIFTLPISKVDEAYTHRFQ